MEGADQRTCGQGLAENSTIPAQLGALTASMAEVLEAHLEALDLQDENARQEHAAYLKLALEQRRVAGELRAIAEEMAGYRDLPMGRHDPHAVSSPKAFRAFESFVTVEHQLLELLHARVEQDRSMLGEMRRAGGSGD
jgi:hypothetical protein